VQRGALLNRTRTDRNRIKKHHHYTGFLLPLSIVLGYEFLRKDSTHMRMPMYSNYLNWQYQSVHRERRYYRQCPFIRLQQTIR
jgi:hypothetical protein